MSKRKIEDNTKSTPAAKKMAGQPNESCASSPKEKAFVYRQDHIDAKSFYLATKLADVHFAFDSGDGTVTRIPAHKILLAVTSDVFEKMFCGGLKESGDVKIVDASEVAFKQFLQFFYLSKVKLSAGHLASVLYLGNKHNVENCIDACVKFFTDNLSNENVCTALSLAILHDQDDLAKQCEKRIMVNTVAVFKSAGFLKCSKGTLAHILKMNLLSCTEVEVFEACVQWVRDKSGQQELSKALIEEHLGDLYYQIRLASLTTKEFCNLETKYSAVLSEDFKTIIRLIENVDITTEQFSKIPRQVKWEKDKDATIICFRGCQSTFQWYPMDNEGKTTFSTNKSLVLGEFNCSGIYLNESDRRRHIVDMTVDVGITEARTLDDATDAKVLCSMKANLGSNETTVSLRNPILIQPDFFYTICVKGFPEGHCFKSCGRNHSVRLDSNIKIQFHNDKTIDGKIIGLIPEFKFYKI